ncbi:G protein-regulated inducer of neurite outgrowth 3 [Hemiscyllium ocellatum]|uniref:G protein-regulated inducer of neurite outgrowth 3 n=1 Tax=Hemiscyllium ocellatum TaxID=170820 RepID=UPI0029670C39|nr:G protein-regulated inducer of neurite outgrowth 3 [Hemiscyllium ocellatum]XP_060692766.1 G protein-regulated inducer of neurite outgrowth 3 [Hemiscyllium ocellatum]
MGTIKDLDSLQISVSEPVEMENKCLPEGAVCNNQGEKVGKAALHSNCQAHCSNPCTANNPDNLNHSHLVETSINVPKNANTETGKSHKTPENDLSKEPVQKESSCAFSNSTDDAIEAICLNIKESTGLNVDSSEAEPEMPLTGCELEDRGMETSSCTDPQESLNQKEMAKPTNVGSILQSDINRLEICQQSEQVSTDIETAEGLSQISTPATTSQDAEVQVAIQVQKISVATSPLAPLDNYPVFKIPDIRLRDQRVEKTAACPVTSSSLTTPPRKDVEMQVDITVQCKSVATGPMTPLEKTPLATLPEVQVEAMEDEQPEPVRDVQWDEKGMTWEVYGASMDAEVLGLAIQKHLEKQIEEHGKQNTEVCQNDKPISRKESLRKEENKRRQSNVFQAVLHNIRSPQCCTRGSTAAE